jgi:hypothetical protein
VRRSLVLCVLLVSLPVAADEPQRLPLIPTAAELARKRDGEKGGLLQRLFRPYGAMIEWNRGNFDAGFDRSGRPRFRDHYVPWLSLAARGSQDRDLASSGRQLDESMARSYPTSNLMLTFAVGFDLTDTVMRLRGEDPYTPAKRGYMLATRDQRWQLALANRHSLVVRALAELPSVLFITWNDSALTSEERAKIFQALFCQMDSDEPGSGPLKSGEEAREILLRFMRTQAHPIQIDPSLCR